MRRLRAKTLSTFLAAMFLSTSMLPSHSGVFKCEKNGKIVYQQTECDVSSQEEAINIQAPLPDIGSNDLPILEYEVYPMSLSPEEVRMWIEKSKAIIRQSLKDPGGAIFQNIKIFQVKHIGGIDTLLCGEVNAKNSYGGYVGFKEFFTRNSRINDTEIVGGIGDAGNLFSTKVNGRWWRYTADDICSKAGNVVSR
jgi:hypothetical protein